MTTNEDLKTQIDWPVVLSQPRYAGGHDKVMQNIFGPPHKVIAHWNEGDYQGQVATAYLLVTGEVVVMTDYYGSCSGCDSWEDSSDAEAEKMILDLVTSAKIFEGIHAAIRFLEELNTSEKPWEYGIVAAANLLPDLRKY